MKKILSTLLVLAMLCSIIYLPVMANTEVSEYKEGKMYYYSDFSNPSDIGTMTMTADGIKPEITTSLDGSGTSVLRFTGTAEGNQSKTFFLLGDKSTPVSIDDGLPLVLEYRVRMDMGTYNYFATNASYAPSVAIAGKDYHNKVRPSTSSTEVIAEINHSKWNTIKVIYSNNSATRDIYVNDTFAKTCDGNPYYTSGNKSLYLPFLPYLNTNKYVELDYVKLYTIPDKFMVKIENSSTASIYGLDVKFNSSISNASQLISKAVVSVGSEDIAVKSIYETGINSYRIIPEKILASNTEYTLSFNNVSDLYGNTLFNSTIDFKTSDSVGYNTPYEMYYNDFNKELDFARIILAGEEVVYGLSTSDDGLSIFKAQGTDVYQNAGNFGFFSPSMKSDFGPDKLVLEYKIRVHADCADSYMGTWRAATRSEALDFSRYEGMKDKLFFHYSDKTPIPGDYTFNPKEWNTITIVYPKNRQSRDIYVNGEFIATSEEGEQNNTYASAGETAFAMLPDFKCSDDLLEVDYYKFTDMTEKFDARLLSADSQSFIVEFNTTPSNLNTDAVTLTDGTSIKEIKAINERTYLFVPETSLSADTYTVSLENVKDSLGRAYNGNSVSFTVDEGSTNEIEYVNYQFEDDGQEVEELKNATSSRRSTFITSSGITNENGHLVLKPGKASTRYITIPKITNSEPQLPKYVIEYKVKINSSVAATYFGYDQVRFAGDTNMIHINSSGVYWSQTDANNGNKLITASEYGSLNEWHTIALEYSNNSHTRTVYIDGVKIGTSVDNKVKEDNYWFNNKYIVSNFKFYSGSDNDSAQFEYIKSYSPSEVFTASVKSVSDDLKTIYLDFNGTAVNVQPDMIKVGGQTPESVTVYDEKNQIYAINLNSKLNAGTTYNLSIFGAKSSLAKECNDVLTFTTRDAKNCSVAVICDIPEAGKISINGTETINASVLEDSDVILTVKPFINYDTVVIVNGTELTADRFDNYIIRDIKDDTEVNVTFNAIDDSPETIETIRSIYTDKTSYWSFGVLRKASDDFGFIAAASEDNLTLDAVASGNAYKLNAKTTNTFGEYGIQIIDLGRKLGAEFYLIPYAVYSDATAYGTALKISR